MGKGGAKTRCVVCVSFLSLNCFASNSSFVCIQPWYTHSGIGLGKYSELLTCSNYNKGSRCIYQLQADKDDAAVYYLDIHEHTYNSGVN